MSDEPNYASFDFNSVLDLQQYYLADLGYLATTDTTNPSTSEYVTHLNSYINEEADVVGSNSTPKEATQAAANIVEIETQRLKRKQEEINGDIGKQKRMAFLNHSYQLRQQSYLYIIVVIIVFTLIMIAILMLKQVTMVTQTVPESGITAVASVVGLVGLIYVLYLYFLIQRRDKIDYNQIKQAESPATLNVTDDTTTNNNDDDDDDNTCKGNACCSSETVWKNGQCQQITEEPFQGFSGFKSSPLPSSTF